VESASSLGAGERLLLSLLPLSSGGAVVVTIVLGGESLLWPTVVLVAGTAMTAVALAWRLPGGVRRALARRVRVGLLAGLAATAAYDAVRYLVVAATSWSVRPFQAFALFGQLLVGHDAPAGVQYLAGTGFHLLNGLGFAVGYAVVVRRPGVVSAIAWALVLEAFTIALYPSWLGLTAVGEFVSVSLLGHLAYGAALGQITAKSVAARGDAQIAAGAGR
jgi:Family of unknown function (DUF6789)